MITGNFIFLDLETTGATADKDRITEIGFIEVMNGQYVDEWNVLVNPRRSIPDNIQAITGISDEMVANAPTFEDISSELWNRLDGKTLVAHNVRFDYSFLKNEFRNCGLAYQPKLLCTVKLSRLLYPDERRHGLDSIIKRLGLTCDTRHRALSDARAIWDFAQHLQIHFEENIIIESIKKLIKEPSLPATIHKNTIDSIPGGSGVYIFKGGNNAVLYVGKSKNIRSRVMSHFSGDHSSRKDREINQQLQSIDWIETAGEFGALLLESQLVKTLQPIFNRQLRKKADYHTIHWDPAAGEKIPKMMALSEFEQIPFGAIYGMFDTKRQATKLLRDLAKEHGLCLKALGIEEGEGPCFSHQLGRCKGACIGDETHLNHAMRTSIALHKFLIPEWPYSGDILVIEKDASNDMTETHRIRDWTRTDYRFTGKNKRLEHQIETPGSFDYDAFQIIRKYLSKKDSRGTIITDPDAQCDQ